ncbi:MAG: hypothetical protein QXE04_01280, partial [Thermoplasmatales archaeon]
VKRERDKEDRRIINVQITERGVKATEEAIQVFNELAADLVKDLSDEDKAKLIELLDKLLEKLMKGKINVEPDQR